MQVSDTKTTKTDAEVVADFAQAMQAAGLAPPDIQADGQLHRFSTTGKKGDLHAWYVLHLDGLPAGAFGCWRKGFTQNWCSTPESAQTEAEKAAHCQRMAQMRATRDAEQVAVQAQAAAKAASLWGQASTPKNNHDYIVSKGISPNYTIRQLNDKLLVPLRDSGGKLHSLQFIDPSGKKTFLTGGKVQGCYYSIGGTPTGKVIVCEGFATGASIFEATGKPVAVAMNAGNLQSVALVLHQKYPAVQIVVAADDDWRTEGNPGMAKATAAAQAVQGLVAKPVFAKRHAGQSDFNDLHQAQGLDAVRACMDQAQAPDALPAPAQTSDRVILVSASDIEPLAICWLWHEWLALGKFHLLAGAPGVGKTTLTLAMAATVSMGGRWPDGSRCEPGNVLIWSGEDDVADTLLPRLLAAGADRKRCHFIGGAQKKGETVPFSLARDIPLLQQAVQSIGGIKLLIVDPVAGVVTGDSHKGNEVRNGLQPLVDFAQACDCAVLGITHFGKGGQGTDPTNRVLGSVAFAAVSRVVLVAAKAKDAEGTPVRIIARSKGNVTPDDGGYQYHLEQVTVADGIETTAVAWGDKVEGTARELLTDPDAPEDSEEGAADAADLLREELSATCWTNAKDAQRAVMSHGFSKKQIWAASKKLAVIRKKGGMQGGWYWRLAGGADPALPEDSTIPQIPEDSTEDSEDSILLERESSESSGALESSQKAIFAQNLGNDFAEEVL